jgi:hypothetical protein
MIAAAIHTVEVWLVALIITIFLLGGFGVFARWCGASPAVRRQKLDQLRVGMTPEEVVAVLGEPRQKRRSPEGVRQWLYGAPMKRHVLLIEFSATDHVESFAHGVPNPRRGGGPPPPLGNV